MDANHPIIEPYNMPLVIMAKKEEWYKKNMLRKKKPK